ncbi:MAG TPA: hypothetical protein VFE46_05530 [Pirellulales bacterium]|jgi:hypothetical protein|nr:hypothetical protein [Pirellulales bacterium]
MKTQEPFDPNDRVYDTCDDADPRPCLVQMRFSFPGSWDTSRYRFLTANRTSTTVKRDEIASEKNANYDFRRFAARFTVFVISCSSVLIWLLPNAAIADEAPVGVHKLEDFNVLGDQISTPLSEFKHRHPDTKLDTSDAERSNGIDCYALTNLGQVSQARFSFYNNQVFGIEVTFTREQIAKFGGVKEISKMLAADFGLPDRTTEVPDLGTISIWTPMSLKRRAEFAIFAEAAVLVVLDTQAEHEIHPPPTPDAAKQELVERARAMNTGFDKFEKSIIVLLRNGEKLGQSNTSDKVKYTYERFREIASNAEQKTATIRAIVQRAADGDTSDEAKDGVTLSARVALWYGHALSAANDRLIRAVDEATERDVRRRQLATQSARDLGYGVGVTMEGYNFLRDGIEKWEADVILNSTGVERSRSGNLVVYCWKDGSKIITATFSSDKLVSKAQSGL